MESSVKAPKTPSTDPLDSSKVIEAKFAKLNRILNAEIQKPLCDDCLEDDDGSKEENKAPAAEIYCRNCRQMLCITCFKYHRKAKACRSHVLVAFERNQLDCDFSVESKVPTVCKRHIDKQHLMNSFCYDCSEVLCKLCLEEFHSKHRCTDVTDVCDRFKDEILKQLTLSLSSEELIRQKKERLKHEHDESEVLIQKLEAEIERIREELKQLVDRQADLLLDELHSLQEERRREIGAFRTRLHAHLAQVDSFKVYATEIANSGSVSDVCQSVRDLKIVNNILENNVKEIVQSELRAFPISFSIGDFKERMEKDERNHFGKIEGQSAYMMNLSFPITTSSEQITNSRFISGITMLNNEVFTTRYMTSELGVYDSSYQFTRAIRVEKSATSWQDKVKSFSQVVRDPHCIVSCSVNECLYVVNRTEKEFSEIVKIDPTGILLKKWMTVDDNSYGRISVTDKGNIVKALYNRSRLMEYTSEGQVIREVILPDCIQRPWHAIQKPNGDFIVSHGQYGDTNHRVCILDSNGKTKASFSQDSSLDTKYLNCPVHLTVCRDGTIILIDANNRRILMLSSMLEFQKELLTRANGIEGRPHSMYINETAKHLLISVEEKFIVFEMKNSESDSTNPRIVNRAISTEN